MIRIWCGTCGQPFEMLFYLTYREVYAIIDGYNDKILNEWRMHRFNAFVAAKVAGAKIKRPEDLLELKGDRPPVRSYDEIINKINKQAHKNEDENMDEIARWLSKQEKKKQKVN